MMEDSFRRKLEENGADVQATLRRFMGNEDMYMKFLKRFLDDTNYKSLGEHLEAGNFEEAFRAAHTLKGVAANLGLTPVQTVVSDLVEELRGKKSEEVDEAKADELWRDLTREYEKFVNLINEG